ncbi:inorganic phosphate transporter [Rhizobium sp. CFBP 8762]|nr:inorganic phosphate transporter [Rhizobium sp. CFBP 8762]
MPFSHPLKRIAIFQIQSSRCRLPETLRSRPGTPALRAPREKTTLDKDLDKLSLREQAILSLLRGWVGLGFGFVFMVLAAMIAASFALGTPGAALVIAGAALAGYMAMNIGANDVNNNVGAAVGAKAMTMTTALVIAAIFEILGAVIGGGEVVTTIESGILIDATMPSANVFAWAMLAALLSSALWINLATWANVPVSTTHSIVGGVIGAGIAASGADTVNWASIAVIALGWVFTPLIGGALAAAFLYFIKVVIQNREDKVAAARQWVPVLLAAMGGAFVAYLTTLGVGHGPWAKIRLDPPSALGAGFVSAFILYLVCRPMVRRQAIGLDNRNQSLRTLFRIPLIFAAALMSFAHGANDVSNAIGPLSGIVRAAQDMEITDLASTPFWVTLIGAFGISLGLMLFGPKLIRLVGEDITRLNPVRAFCVVLSASTTVIVASWLGLPVSSTHIAVGAVFGIGFFREWYMARARRLNQVSGNMQNGEVDRNRDESRRRYLVRRSHFMTIVAAWVVTVPVSALLSAGVFLLLSLFFM